MSQVVVIALTAERISAALRTAVRTNCGSAVGALRYSSLAARHARVIHIRFGSEGSYTLRSVIYRDLVTVGHLRLGRLPTQEALLSARLQLLFSASIPHALSVSELRKRPSCKQL